jgi:hypothetical protein
VAAGGATVWMAFEGDDLASLCVGDVAECFQSHPFQLVPSHLNGGGSGGSGSEMLIVYTTEFDSSKTLLELKSHIHSACGDIATYSPSPSHMRLWDSHRLLKGDNSTLKNLRVADGKILTIEALGGAPQKPMGKHAMAFFVHRRLGSVGVFEPPRFLIVDHTDALNFGRLKGAGFVVHLSIIPSLSLSSSLFISLSLSLRVSSCVE